MLGFTYVNQKNYSNKDSEIQRAARFARANGWYARVIPIAKDRAMSPNSAGGAPRWGLFVASKPGTQTLEWPRIENRYYDPIDRLTEDQRKRNIKINFGGNASGSIQKKVRDHIIKDRYGAKYRFGPSILNDFYQGSVATPFNDQIFNIKTDDYQWGASRDSFVDYGANSEVMIYNRKFSEIENNELQNAMMTDDVMFQMMNATRGWGYPTNRNQEWKLAGPNYAEINIWLRKQKAYDPTLNMRDNIIKIAGPKGWESVEKAQRINENFRQAQELSEGMLVRPLGAPKEIDWHKEVYEANKEGFAADLLEVKDFNPRYDQWINWAFDSVGGRQTITERGRILNTLRKDLLSAKYSSDANQLDTNSIDESVVNYLKENPISAGGKMTKKVDQSWRKIVNLPDPQKPQLSNVQGKINWSGGGQ
jgi:hypothetical protein